MWQSSQVLPTARASSWAINSQVTPATMAPQAANSSQAGRIIIPRPSPLISQADSALPLAESTISQTGNSQASPADSTLSQAKSEVSQAGIPQSFQADSALPLVESAVSQTGNSQAFPADNTISQAESEVSQAGIIRSSQADSALPLVESTVSQAGHSQAFWADNTLSQAESMVSQTGIPHVTPVVRHSARLRASQAFPINNSQAGNTPSNSPRQAGNTPMTDSALSQPDSRVSQVASSQASASQEARSSPLPNRQNSPKGSSSMEEPNPKWVINLSSKPLTKTQRSVLAKGPSFVVFPKHPPNLEYITAIEAACAKLSQHDAEELRADIIWVLKASHP